MKHLLTAILLFIVSCTNNKKTEKHTNQINTLNFPQDNLERFTILEEAIRNNQLDIIKYGIEQGFPINFTEPHYQRTLLHIAANQGQNNIIDYLMSQGADINAFTCNDVTGWQATPLIFSVYSDQKNTAKYLLENYAHKITNISTITAYMLNTALRNGDHFLVLQYLVDEYQEKLTTSHMFIAVQSMDTNILQFVFDRGITNVFITNHAGKTLVEYISDSNNFLRNDYSEKKYLQILDWVNKNSVLQNN